MTEETRTPEPPPPPAPPRAEGRPPRWMTVALVVSVAVNLLILGLVVGASFGHDRDDMRTRMAGMRELGATPFVMALEPRDRVALGRALAREAEPLRTNRAELRQRFEALLSALRAETFDRASVERLIADQRTAASRRQEIGEAALLQFLEEMSPAERRAYADRLDRSLRRAP